MGLFKELALLPLAPVRGTAWVAEQLADEADRQLYDEDNIRRELLQLELEYEDGDLSDEERAAMEDDLLERLAIARQRVTEDQRESLGAEAERGGYPESEERFEDG
jgi:hypothetical protein